MPPSSRRGLLSNVRAESAIRPGPLSNWTLFTRPVSFRKGLFEIFTKKNPKALTERSEVALKEAAWQSVPAESTVFMIFYGLLTLVHFVFTISYSLLSLKP